MLLDDMRWNWRRRIKKLGLSPQEFCEQAGISMSTYYKSLNPTKRTLDKIDNKLLELEGEV